MTAAQEAKAAGLKSLQQMCELSNIPRSTMYDIFRDNHQQFHVLLIGCVNLIKNCEAADNGSES